MTAEGYDYEYALTTSIHDEWGYGSYSSTTGTFTIEVTVDPPAWTCGSCREVTVDPPAWTCGSCREVTVDPPAWTCGSCREVTVDPPAWTCGSCRKDKRLWTRQAAGGRAARR